MDYEQLGRRIRQQRVLNRMTQEQLAELAGVSCAFVGHIERGEKKASIETIVALCNALEVSPTVLLQDSLKREIVDSQLGGIGHELVSDIMTVLREHKRRDPDQHY